MGGGEEKAHPMQILEAIMRQDEACCNLLRCDGRVEIGAGPFGTAAADHEFVDFLGPRTSSSKDCSRNAPIAYFQTHLVVTGVGNGPSPRGCLAEKLTLRRKLCPVTLTRTA